MNSNLVQIQDKISISSASEASIYINSQMEDSIKQKNTAQLINILSILYVPENREILKLLNLVQVFQYLLQNVRINQVSQIYQSFFENNINACEKSLVQIIEVLAKEENYEEIDQLLNSVQKHPDKINLSELFQPLIKCNNLTMVMRHIVNLPTEMYGYMDVWEKLIDNSVQKSIGMNDLRKTLNEFALKIQFQKPEILLKVYNQLLAKMILYQADLQVVKSTVLDMIKYKLEIQEQIQNTFLIDHINKVVDFRDIIKFIIQLRYCLKSATFTSILRYLIQSDRKFELFCLIELILREKGFSFKFEDLLLSQQEFRYIIVQQSYFHNFLSKLERRQSEISFEHIDQLRDFRYLFELIQAVIRESKCGSVFLLLQNTSQKKIYDILTIDYFFRQLLIENSYNLDPIISFKQCQSFLINQIFIHGNAEISIHSILKKSQIS